MMKYYLLIFTLLMTESAIGCHCVPRTADDYLSKCDQLFIAKIVEITEATNVENVSIYRNVEEGRLSSPIKIIKGNPINVDKIINYDHGSSCDSPLAEGENYVVCVVDSEPLNNFMCGFTHHIYEKPDEFAQKFK